MARREPLPLTSIWVLFVLVLFVWHDQCNRAQHTIFNIGFENSTCLDQVGMLFPASRTGHGREIAQTTDTRWRQVTRGVGHDIALLSRVRG